MTGGLARGGLVRGFHWMINMNFVKILNCLGANMISMNSFQPSRNVLNPLESLRLEVKNISVIGLGPYKENQNFFLSIYFFGIILLQVFFDSWTS